LAQQAGDDPQVRLETAKAQRRVGRILMLLGRNAEAESELNAAAALLKTILDQISAKTQVEIELAHVRRLQGALLTATRESRLAHLSEAVDILQRHASDPTADHSVRLELGACLSALANQQRQGGDHRGALASFEAAERVFVALTESNPDDRDAAIRYAKHLQNFGVSFESAGDWTAAASKFAQAVEVARTLVDSDPRDSEGRHVLATALLGRANVLMRQERHMEADALYAESRAIMRRLVDDYPSFPQYRLRLSGTLMNACWSASKVDEPERGVAYAEEAVAVLQYLTDQWPEVREYHSALGGALSNFAWLLCTQEIDPERATALSERAIQEGRLALESPGDASSFLMKSHNVLANAQMQLGRWSEARATCLAGLQVAETLKKKRPDDPDIPFMIGDFQHVLQAAEEREANMPP
jgi:tetratricopeptide (TPR) repeat protein